MAFVGLTSSFFLKRKVYEKVWIFPQRIWIFKEEFRMVVYTIVLDNLESQRAKGSTVNKWGTWIQVRRCCLCKSPLEDHIKLGIWWRRSNPMRRSLPVRGDPRTWCLMARVGKILMKIGLLFRVIRVVSPFATRNIWLWGNQNYAGKILGWRIVAATSISNKAITGMGLE